MFPDVLRVLLDRVPERAPAVAEGWRVTAMPGLVYPGLVPSPAGRALGLLITGLTRDEWRILDAFENDLYDLRRIPLDEGRHGWTYVCKDEAQTSPDEAWDASRFETEQLAAYVGRCQAWRQRHVGGGS